MDSSHRNQKSSLKLRLTLLKGRLSDIYNKTYRNQIFFLFLVVPENYKQCASQKYIEIQMFNISPCAQAYIEIQLSNLSPWHIPISSQRDPAHGSPRTQQEYLPLSVVRQSHVTRGQHISPPQGTAWTEPPCSAHPWHLSLHYSSERLE